MKALASVVLMIIAALVAFTEVWYLAVAIAFVAVKLPAIGKSKADPVEPFMSALFVLAVLGGAAAIYRVSFT